MNNFVAELKNVTLRYGKVTALNNVSLDFPAGITIGIIGPDGVGKSSMLSLISGARKIQEGNILIFGKNIDDKKIRTTLQPRIAYMPQGLGKNLYPALSIFENLDFFARLFGQEKEERETRIRQLTDSTGLLPFLDRPASQLSGGMKQKLGLCCSLIHDPDLLILDEPTTGVDPLSRRQFWELIDAIREKRPHMSVMVSTAYMDEAEQFEWLVAMNAGEVIGKGTAEELKKRTNAKNLEEAFIRLLPESQDNPHKELIIPPRKSSDNEWAIEAENLTQQFGDFTAVDNVSFKIGKGEIFGFLGSNGCGKTTTMKMLTGLLPPTKGSSKLFGQHIDANNLDARKQVGYMSQSFSLYGELTTDQNLYLHARLFHLPADKIKERVDELVERFGLEPYLDMQAANLPLGIKQRLSLAVSIVHSPKLLILDEPTSGVDPVARDQFWELLIELSREQEVTIFISTHFMNEAERCDRISLMHAGKVLDSDTPDALREKRGAKTLEEAFIAYLEDTDGKKPPPEINIYETKSSEDHTKPFSLGRLLAYAYREGLELRRDPIRLTVALLGSVMMMFALGFGISMDVEDLHFAVFDQDRTPESRKYIENISGSRYFLEKKPIHSNEEMEKRIRSGELTVALEIPPNFGRDLRIGRNPEIVAMVDGAMPFRAETTLGYVQGLHLQYLRELVVESTGNLPDLTPTDIAQRYRYNQDFKSIYAMVPAVIPLLLVLIPSILMALGVVREKEMGSITNLYVTPVTRLEFILGKQLPYIVVSMLSFVLLILQSVFIFDVPIKGSILALSLGALLYVTVTTGMGLLISTFTKTQTAAIFGTAILTVIPASQFSGFTTPTASLMGAGRIIGECYPTTYYLIISRGAFTKALTFNELWMQFLILAAFIPILTILSQIFLPKQEK